VRALFVIGVVVLVLGLASLFIPLPSRERHGIEAGGVSIGVETVRKEKVHPAVSAVLIGGGILLMVACHAEHDQ
jgi:hypothetical protein